MSLDDWRDSKRSEPLYGIGGWLAFLCISMLIIRTIRILAILLLPVLDGGPIFGSPVIIGTVALEVLGLAAAVLMYRLQPLGVLLAKIFFGVRIAVGIASIFTALIGQFFPDIGPSIAWLIYLYRSERVHNTYAQVAAEGSRTFSLDRSS